MSNFGWMHISGAVSGKGIAGSLQYPKTTNGELTGSQNLSFSSGSNTLFLTGTMIISGTLQAHTFDVIHTNKIELSSSGGTNFGDSCDDTHVLTGSLTMASGAIKQYYNKVTAATYAVTNCDSIIGISSSAYVSLTLPAVSTQGSGRTIIIKDEYVVTRAESGGTHIAISASGADKIDHQSSYVIEGDSVALTLYCDGINKWFIY